MGRGASCRPIGGSGQGTPLTLAIPGVGFVKLPPVPVNHPSLVHGIPSIATPVPTASNVPTGGIPAGTPEGLDQSVPNPVIDTTRMFPDFNVLGFVPANRVVKQLYVEETAGFELPMVKVVLNNVKKFFQSTKLAQEQSSFPVIFGYKTPGVQNHGTFIVQRPKFKYSIKDLVVEIVGYGEAVKLGATERREIYQKQSDSDIAAQIADRNGFGSDVDDTEVVHDQVIQANESDYKFLARRAKMYGYLLYVENGVMHFHLPRPRESGIRLTVDDATSKANLRDFTVHSRTFMRGLKLSFTQIDPITKEEFSVDSSEDPDPIQSLTDYQNWIELTSISGIGQPQRFITNEGHEQIQPLMQRQMDRMAQSTRYVIAGEGVCAGIETLRARDIVTVDGIGRSSGRYFITKVAHELHVGKGTTGAGGYMTRFEVIRAGAGELDDAAGTPVDPVSAGTFVEPVPV